MLVAGGHLVISDVHPFFTALSLHGIFPKSEGRLAFVRNHFHPHARYLEAFVDAGLRVAECIEPSWSEQVFET